MVMDIDLNTILLTALLTMLGWLGRRALIQLDKVVGHLACLDVLVHQLDRRLTLIEKEKEGLL